MSTASPTETKTSTPKAGRRARSTSLLAHGEPFVWLTGGALALTLAMVLGLLGLVAWQGGRTFWPKPIKEVTLVDGARLLGEVARTETFEPKAPDLDRLPAPDRAKLESYLAEHDGAIERQLLRTGNFESSGTTFDWVSGDRIAGESWPEWAVVLERFTSDRLYGVPMAFLVEGEVRYEGAEATWRELAKHLPEVLVRIAEIQALDQDGLGPIRIEQADQERSGGDPARKAALALEYEKIEARIKTIEASNETWAARFLLSDGSTEDVPLAEVRRAISPNRLGFSEKLAVYFDRWGEFLSEAPRQANSQGGVWPALFGTAFMTIVMSLLVVPFGVLAALYIREYAKQGLLISLVRIAVNNLAGVPSIVFGVFGLGFFCYLIGGQIDQLFFAERAFPTYGKGGILWASLTLALLTLPVVIVATEESLAAVPNSMREGSYACGASKWQTIRRIVLPRALPGIMTGMILAIARGAGEVAPLMLVGAVNMAPDLPLDLNRFPYIFPERSFLHLGLHIFDVGFKSQDSEGAKPMVYTTTLLLIAVVVLLNVAAIRVRTHLRRKFQAGR